ncbi:MAG: spheroidene monooxygenase [Pseudomonadota bacterium]
MTQTVSLSFFRFSGPGSKLWAFSMMGISRMLLPRVPDIGFWKLCGSGTGEGFTPIPNTAVYAILCTWPDADTARSRVEKQPLFERYRKKAVESWTVYLTPTQSRGNWSGQEPFDATGEATEGPLAALTRATIKPRVLFKFWGRVPDISKMIGLDENVAFKIGIGELPWLHQITFSIWPSPGAMARFARHDGPHARAIRAVRQGAWFSEELYARFAVTGDHGQWEGRSPLADLPPICHEERSP